MSSTYTNVRVQALLDGHTSIDGTWTEDDYLQLALAAIDQAGVSLQLQRRVNEWVDDELAERDARAVNQACMEDE